MKLKDLEKFGYCPKQIHHIIRLNQLIKDIYQNNISFGDALLLNRLPEFSSYLIKVKKGELSLEQARLLAKEKECLIIRAPITNENISIYGDEEEIKWLHLELVKCDAYTYK